MFIYGLNIHFICRHIYYIHMDVSRGNASGLKWEGRMAVDNEAREDPNVFKMNSDHRWLYKTSGLSPVPLFTVDKRSTQPTELMTAQALNQPTELMTGRH